MRDLNTLKALLASINNKESSSRLSSNPFQPSMLNWLISKEASQFYSKE